MLVLLATSTDWPDLFADDHPLKDALIARGVDARAAVWDDDTIDWSEADLVVLRSIWDYTGRRDAFVQWVDSVEQVVPVQNPAAVVRWNSHKWYLRDLEAAGIPTIPTAWLDAGTTVDARDIAAERGWTDVVVKPCVSAGARSTVRGAPEHVQVHIDASIGERDLMMQPYVGETEQIGEHSLIYLGGALSHVVRKDPALVTADYSSSNVVPVEAHPAELALASRVIEHIGPLLYARVDCVVIRGEAHVMEVELIEPQLFFRHAPQSAERMAELITELL